MKRQNIHEIIPEKSEEDIEFTISVKNERFENNSQRNKKEKIVDIEQEEQTEGDFLDNQPKEKGNKKLLINLNKLPDRNESLTKSKIITNFKEDPFIKKFNSDHGNHSVTVLSKLYDKDEKKRNASYLYVPTDHAKLSKDYLKEIKFKIRDEKIYKNNNDLGIRSKNFNMENAINTINENNYNSTSKNREEIEKFISIQSLTNTEKMRFKELWNYFSSIDLSEERNSIIVEDFSKYNCCLLIILKCSKKFVLDNELIDERQLAFSLTKIPLNIKEEIHIRTMTTIYQNLTKEVDCPLLGNHWIKIGFQSSDPKNDLRSTGMFSMLQILAFIDRFHQYVMEIFEYSKTQLKYNCFACILINMSYYSIQTLREGILISFCNKFQSVINTLNDFYIGLVDLFFEDRKDKKLSGSNENINDVIKSLAKFAKNNPNIIFDRVRNLMIKYPQLNKDSMSLGEEINKT